MASGIYNFVIEQGSTFDVRLDYKDKNLQPVDLTYWHARMHIRPNAASPTIYARLSSSLYQDGTGLNMTPNSASVVLPKSSGSIQLYISAATSSNFTWTEAYYDIELVSGSRETVVRLLKGRIKVDKNVTR